MSAYPLSLTPIVDVTATVEAGAISAPSFQGGLVIGNSGRIPTTGSNSRIRQYSSTTAMLADGFQATDPEYLAAQLYFSPTPTAPAVFVGAQDPTAIHTVAVDATEGTGYVVGDILSIVQGTASGATVKVTTIGANGAVTAVSLLTQGTKYSVATGLATTGGTGNGCLIDITAIGETPLQAVTACRLKNANWYACMVCGAIDTDHAAIAAYIQGATPQSLYFYASTDTSASQNSVFAQLQTQTIGRAFGHASTTQSGEYPNNAYAAASDMGVAMGLNTGLPGSNFTMMFKSLPGIAAEPLSQSQVTALEAQNANLYLNRTPYTFLEQGKVASGQFLDIQIGLDLLLSQIQIGVMNLFVGQPSVPQTDSGEALILNVIDQACAAAVTRGFLAAGVWTGNNTIGKLKAGTSLPKGYLIQTQSFAAQSSGDQQARKGMPVTVSVITANAIQSISIGLMVQV